MDYREFPISQSDSIVWQLAGRPMPRSNFEKDGTRTPKVNNAGEQQWAIPVVCLDIAANRMSTEEVKVFSPVEPCASASVGSVIELMNPTIYAGSSNGKTFYGLKAQAIKIAETPKGGK